MVGTASCYCERVRMALSIFGLAYIAALASVTLTLYRCSVIVQLWLVFEIRGDD